MRIYELYCREWTELLWSFVMPCIDFIEGKVCSGMSPCVIHVHDIECHRPNDINNPCRGTCRNNSWWKTYKFDWEEEVQESEYDTIVQYLYGTEVTQRFLGLKFLDFTAREDRL